MDQEMFSLKDSEFKARLAHPKRKIKNYFKYFSEYSTSREGGIAK